VPPNFSAFETVEDAVETAAREGVGVVGTSNFHDYNVYTRFEEAAHEHGVVPLFGLEFISVLEEEQAAGIRINDPENPGRAYVCGKGIPAPDRPSPETQARLAAAKQMNEKRTSKMVDLLNGMFSGAGVEADLTYASIADGVAARARVPADWVVLQERHVAQAFQELLYDRLASDARPATLERILGGPPKSDPSDAIKVQGELRSRLMKADRPAFVPETPIPFRQGLDLVLGMDAIPCYPTLADGADPICGFEDPASALTERILSHGIYGAELIPIRNAPAVVEDYVTTWRDAGIFVLLGTEHNTQARIPVEPRCVDGSLPSESVRDIVWEGTCIVAAHQHLRASGKGGYVDSEGRLDPGFPDAESRMRYFKELGEEILMNADPEVAA
jgi:hypothetical protein